MTNEVEGFTPGDLVSLNSGGPTMTIKQIGSGGYIYCLWFEGHVLHDGVFHYTGLIKRGATTEQAQ